ASERLHVSAVPDALPCREEEFANIYTQLESAIEEGEGMCLYISGIPGTGKTATVNAVVRALNERVESQELMPFQYVELNGMKLSEPQQAYVQLWEHISGQRVGPSYAESLLLTHFTTPRPGRQPCVVLIDELDLLVARKQKLVYNFFEWPNLKHSRLIVIAIANTMDLPERELTNKVSSRLGLTRISFLPYTFQQLISIIGARLEGVVDIDAEAIEFCARKVSSVVGDARRALDLCRRGIEMAEKEGKDKITWKHIEAAFRDLFSSPVLKALKHLSYHQLLFLVSILRQIRVTGMAQVSYGQVTEEHYKLCYQQNKKPPSYVDMCNICTGLSQYRLIISELKSDPTQKIQVTFLTLVEFQRARSDYSHWQHKG
ncbi:P-loop containing nucleoside triphosphate hydrolase protein, partial [Gorgonomyces haynaldii]